jgi:hypothetical protein
MSKAKRHFKLTLKVRYRAESKVKHTLERPGIWPFNRKKREGTTTTLLECDDCVIRVAEANLGEVVKMMSEDPSLKNLVGFYAEAMGDYGCFPEDWDDTEWLNHGYGDGEFIHDSYEGFSEDYVLWDSEEAREEYFEDLRDWDEEVIEPTRRIMHFEKSLDDGEIEPPWKITDSAPWGGWASGAFYPAFPTILIDDVELMEIRTVAKEEASKSSNQSETVISLEEFKLLKGRS